MGNNYTVPPNVGGAAYATTINEILDLYDGAVFNVKAPNFGAVGDGVTDDAAAIQDAIDACVAAGGGIVLLPPGTYLLGARLSFNADSVTIRGSGETSIFKLDDNVDDHVLVGRGNYIRFEDFVIDGNIAGQNGTDHLCGLIVTDSTGPAIRGVRVHDCQGTGIMVSNSSGAGVGAVVSGAIEDATVTGCTSHDNGNNTTFGNGIAFVGVNWILCANNVSRANAGDGIYTQSLTQFSISGNLSVGNGGYGISLQTTMRTGTISGNACIGNGATSASGYGSGIGSTVIAVMDNITITANTCDSNYGNGIYIAAGAGNPRNIAVVANTCKNNGQGVPNSSGSGISLSGSIHCSVIGNHCFDDLAGVQRYGIEDGGGGSELIVVGNYTSGNASGGMLLPGAKVHVGLNYPDCFWQASELSADPAAPAASNGRFYFKDNGSGKTQFCVRFPTGSVQILATEP